MTLALCIAESIACGNRAAGLQEGPLGLSVITSEGPGAPPGAPRNEARTVTTIESGCRVEMVIRSVDTDRGRVRALRAAVEIPASLASAALIDDPSLRVLYNGAAWNVVVRGRGQLIGGAPITWLLEMERGADA